MRTSVDLSYFQDWSPFILTLELHPMMPDEDLFGPVQLQGLVSLHSYLGYLGYIQSQVNFHFQASQGVTGDRTDSLFFRASILGCDRTEKHSIRPVTP